MKAEFSRGSFLKSALVGLSALVCAGLLTLNGFAQAEEEGGAEAEAEVEVKAEVKKKMLVVYFSHSGNTRHVAEEIHKFIGADLHEIRTVEPYPASYQEVVAIAKEELAARARPELVAAELDLTKYDRIFVGFPNWCGTMPMPMFTFFAANDFSGKTIYPFITHEGSRFGNSINELEACATNAIVHDGLALRGRTVQKYSSRQEILSWLDELGIRKK